jgi:hypothetical protein
VIAIADARRVEGACEAIDGSIAPARVFGRRDRYVTDWNDSAGKRRPAGICMPTRTG